MVPAYASKDSGAAAGSLLAPMPGKVVKVAVEAGAAVEEGDLLMTIEAMKMEHAIRAPRFVFSSFLFCLRRLEEEEEERSG